MQKMLLPVDGSKNSDRAVAYAIGLAKRNPDTELHVIHVQPPLMSARVASFVNKEAVDDYHREESETAMRSAKAMLAAEGIEHRVHIVVGPTAETIAEYAAQLGCDSIVMGTRGLGSVGGLLLGSVATKVMHLTGVPVTLVK